MKTTLLILLFLSCFGSWVRGSETIDCAQGWRFIREDQPPASQPAFDDSTWQTVDLPHTWNSTDAAGGSQHYYRGPGWYRRHFSLTEAQSHQSVYVWIGACGSAAEVFVNGQSVGKHEGAFGAFCFDATAPVKSGDNVLAIRATNEKNPAIAPLGGDFNVQGGLYRDARILIKPAISISPLDDGSCGVYAEQNKVSADSAELKVTAVVRNATSANGTAPLHLTLKDSEGKPVATESVQQPVDPSSISKMTATLKIGTPHLWNGRLDPYLYSLEVELNGDVVTQSIGLRSFKVDPQQGFILNGKPYNLHGVNRHQDFAGLGWAITDKQMQTDIDLLNELNVTCIRLAHYQHSPKFYALCDQAGIVVWAELCFVNLNSVPLPKPAGDKSKDTEYEPISPEFGQILKQQLRELIKQNFNDPSICFWSLFNELDYTANSAASQMKLVRECNELAHQLDPTRLTTAATHKPGPFEGNWIPDITGFNRYWGWYSGTVADWPKGLDDLHAIHPDHPIGISEFGAGASIHQHELNPTTAPAHVGGPWHPEEWQSVVLENAWIAIKARPYLWGSFIWNFSDFAADNRKEGDTPGINDKGLITFDRKTKKDAFYFMKANWNPQPMVWITSKGFSPRPQPISMFKVYSNCASVELTVNGVSQGSRSNADHIMVWNNIDLKQGENQIVATASVEGKTLTDQCTIVLDPAATTGPSK